MHKLPLDTSIFSRLRELDYLYVDKTEYMYQMLTTGHRFFLSRPRRFGKSLLVSTLKEILTANKALFTDLWIGNSDYQWQEHGVINLDFSKLTATDTTTFKSRLCDALTSVAQQYQLSIATADNSPDAMLEKLASELYQRFGRVAVLVDEYDSPILKTLHDETLAKEIRAIIQQFFTVIKALDAQIHFAFITGVSSFAKAGLFSGINNLQILTLNKQFAGICGYTDEEIDHYFADRIRSWAKHENISYDQLRQQIKTWYNGYRFGNDVAAVYNPFSVMNALNIQEFKNFWFQSGTPTFLVEIIKKNEYSFDPEKMTTTEDALGIFDVGLIPLTTLMFQAGYLTISKYNPNSGLFTLDYPNEEVRVSFQKYLLEVFARINPASAAQLSAELYEAFDDYDIEEVVSLLYQLFAHVPYQLHVKAEKYYHSLLMMICIGAGIKAQSEYSTNLGQIDLVLEFSKITYVIEVKFNKTAEEALDQIKERRYYERFIKENKKTILLGLAFKRQPTVFDITYAIEEIA
jgi:Predicted AAA-ATPase/PD-(D/E)XK nuclease superfamily